MRIVTKRFLLLVLCGMLLNGCASPDLPGEAALSTASPSAAETAEATPSPAPPTPVPEDTSGSFLTAEEAGYVPLEIISTDCTRNGVPFTEIYSDEVITLWFVSLSSDLKLGPYITGGKLCYNLLVENHTADPLKLSLGYVAVNGCALASSQDLLWNFDDMGPGSRMPVTVAVNYDVLEAAGISEIRQTDFSVDISNMQYESVGQSDRFRIRLKTNKDLDASFAAYHAALDGSSDAYHYTGPAIVEASKFDRRGLCVEMLSLSGNTDGDLLLRMRYENDSEVPLCIVCDGVVLNGIQFGIPGSSYRLLPGEYAFQTLLVEQDDMAVVSLAPIKTIAYYGHIEPLMVNKSYSGTKYHFDCITASTNAPADGALTEADFTPIFDADGIEIYTLKQDPEEVNGYRAVTLCVKNTTDEIVNCSTDQFLADGRADVLDSWSSYKMPDGNLLPHAIAPFSFYLSDSLFDGEHAPLFSELRCGITISSIYDDTSSVTYTDIPVFSAVPTP